MIENYDGAVNQGFEQDHKLKCSCLLFIYMQRWSSVCPVIKMCSRMRSHSFEDITETLTVMKGGGKIVTAGDRGVYKHFNSMHNHHTMYSGECTYQRFSHWYKACFQLLAVQMHSTTSYRL